MRAYIVRRLLLIVPTFLIVTIAVFVFIRLIPGDVVEYIARGAMKFGSAGVDPTESIRHELGLDVPVWTQYGQWLSGVIRGDLGESFWSSASVAGTLRQKMPVSLELGIMALTFSLGVAFPVGIYSALRPDTKIDYFLRSIAIAFIVTPSFWLATMIMIYPSIWWNWSPRTAWVSFGEDALANLGMFIIPAIVLGMWYTGVTMRLIRTMMLEVLRQDYVRTAWAKGLREWVITLRHVLKNTLIPVVSLMGLQLPVLIGGSIVVEQIFGLPGMGLLIVEAINRRDPD